MTARTTISNFENNISARALELQRATENLHWRGLLYVINGFWRGKQLVSGGTGT